MQHAYEDNKLIHLLENLKTGNTWESATGQADHNRNELRCQGVKVSRVKGPRAGTCEVGDVLRIPFKEVASFLTSYAKRGLQ